MNQDGLVPPHGVTHACPDRGKKHDRACHSPGKSLLPFHNAGRDSSPGCRTNLA